MFLVQILLPLHDKTGDGFSREKYEAIASELTERFGGVTAFTRTPAEGRWKPEGESTNEDDIVVIEVMVEDLERAWWQDYRKGLERAFKQDTIVVRAQDIRML
mgnify:CR=1 FL=1